MKKLVKISAILLSKEDSAILHLKNEYYLVLIPKTLVVNYGVNSDTFDFNLISKNGVMSLELACQQNKGQGLLITNG